MDRSCDVAVIGAGPAGSMTAWALASAGLDVALLDRHEFPRDKVCGDALMPDALRALEEAGIAPAVRREALPVSRAIFRSPAGASVEVGGRFLTIRRERLDAILLQHAASAGARFVPGFTVTQPIFENGELRGIEGRGFEGRGFEGHHGIEGRGSEGRGSEGHHRIEGRGSEGRGSEGHRGIDGSVSLRCRIAVLCSGSNPGLLASFGVLERKGHSAVAIRTYLKDLPSFVMRGPTPSDGSHGSGLHSGRGSEAPPLLISYERALVPGYGWAFPLPGGTWNVGCGVFFREPSRRAPRRAIGQSVDLRVLLQKFLGSDGALTEDAHGPEGTPCPETRSGEEMSLDARLPARGGRLVPEGSLAFDATRALPPSDRAHGEVLAPPPGTIQGATLRTGFAGALPRRGNVLVAGEALGLTLPLTGDGIGKAMQSGLIAARTITAALARSARDPDLAAYERTLEAEMRSLYKAYGAAQRWMRLPAVPDLLVRRAARSRSLRHTLEQVVAEEKDPRSLLSLPAFLRVLIHRA